MTSLLKAGIPLIKVDRLRELFEENGYSLCSSTHLRQLIPFILHDEVETLKQEISGRPISIIFDGTTHVAEASVVVLRFIDNWTVVQRVSRLMLLAKSVTGEEVARLLVETLSTQLGIASHLINPRRACAARVTVLALCVCLCVCVSVCYRSSSYSVRFSLQ